MIEGNFHWTQLLTTQLAAALVSFPYYNSDRWGHMPPSSTTTTAAFPAHNPSYMLSVFYVHADGGVGMLTHCRWLVYPVRRVKIKAGL